MPTIKDQIELDAAVYQQQIKGKYDKYSLIPKIAPVTEDNGDAYMKSYKQLMGSPYVIKLTREAVAFLYKQMYDSSVGAGKPMAGNFAVGFAKRNPDNLKTPDRPADSDPNWDQRKAYKHTVMLGYWDEAVGIRPFEAEVSTPGGVVKVLFYDDWNQEYP